MDDPMRTEEEIEEQFAPAYTNDYRGCTICDIWERIQAFRKSEDRLMIEKNGSIGVGFFRRKQPEKKCLYITFNADVACAVVDVFAAVVGVFTVFALVRSMSRTLHFLRYKRR